MPAGARGCVTSSTKAAPAFEAANAARYLRLSRNGTSSGPAVSSGATSTKSRSPCSGTDSAAPVSAASASSENGPARSKKRESAICLARLCAARAALLLFRLRRGGSRRRGRGRGRRRARDRRHEFDRQRRHLLIELLQHFVGYVERLVEQHQLRTLQHQVRLSGLGNLLDDLQ